MKPIFNSQFWHHLCLATIFENEFSGTENQKMLFEWYFHFHWVFFFFFGLITKWSRLTLIKTSLPYLFSFPSRLLSPISKNSLRHFFQFLWLHIKMRIHFSENGKPKKKTLPKIFSPYRTYDFLDLKTWYGLGQVSNCTRSF